MMAAMTRNGHNSIGGVTIQTKPEKDAGENKIIAVARAQAADQIKQQRRDKQRIKRKAQPDAGNNIRPIADARQKSASRPTRGLASSLPSKYIYGSVKRPNQDRPDLQAQER